MKGKITQNTTLAPSRLLRLSERVLTSPGLLIGSQIQGTSGPAYHAKPPSAAVAALTAPFRSGKAVTIPPTRSPPTKKPGARR